MFFLLDKILHKKNFMAFVCFCFFSIKSVCGDDTFESISLEPPQVQAGRTILPETRDAILNKVCEALMLTQPYSPECVFACGLLLESMTLPQEPKRYSGDFQEFREDMVRKNKKTFRLFAFGSLMDQESSRDLHKRQGGALAFGVKRYFGHIHPDPYMSPYGIPHQNHEEEVLRLTAMYTGHKKDYMNGLLFEVDFENEFENFCIRERGYDLIQLPVMGFSHKGFSFNIIDDAYMLVENAHNPKNFVNGGIKSPKTNKVLYPHVPYLYGCLRGVLSLMEDFSNNLSPVRLFTDTTYLADNKTTVSEWIKQQTHFKNLTRDSLRASIEGLQHESYECEEIIRAASPPQDAA